MTRAALRSGAVLATCLLAACSRGPDETARRYLQSGDRFAARGRDAAAVIEYRNAVRLAPSSDEAYRRLGGALARLGRVEQSRAAYERAESFIDGRVLPHDEAALRTLVESHPRHVGARLALADRLLERRAYGEAREHLEAARTQDPARELINRGLAEIELAEGRMREAEDRLRLAAAAEPQRHRSTLALADFLFAQGRWNAVRTALDAAERDRSLTTAVAIRRAALADETGSPEQARRELARLLALHPTAEAWALRAQFAFADGDLGAAEAAARTALSLNPRLVPAQALVDGLRWERLRAPHPRSEDVRPAARAR